MTKQLFVDTGAWIALEVSNDQNHLAATSFLRAQGFLYRWVTTNWVLSETVTWLRRRSTHAAALGFGTRLRNSRQVTVVCVGAAHEDRAWEIFARYDDKDFGYVDCTSFAVMESMGTDQAFSFDKHFRQFGFDILPYLG